MRLWHYQLIPVLPNAMQVQCKNRRYTYQKLGKNPKAKKVVKLSLDNEYICSYDCIKSAMLDNNINLLSSSISACCKHKQKSAYGYKWLYQEEWQLIYDEFKEYLD